MPNENTSHAQQPAAGPSTQGHNPGVAGTAFDAFTTTCGIATEAAGLLGNVPYVEAIAGMVTKIATIKDEMTNNKKRCAELTERVCSGLASVSSNLQKIASTGHPELLTDLKSDLVKFLQFLEDIQAQLNQWRNINRFSRLLKRAEVREKMEQFERQIAAFHEQFNMNQIVEVRMALTKKAETPAATTAPQPLPPKPRVVIGREEDIMMILNALKKHGKTPVRAAILGPGGMGKTTIALSILHDNEIELQYKEERYFVSCESATNADLLLNNIADAIGLPTAGREQNQLTSQINIFFRHRHAVLCFDNLETTWDEPVHRPEVNKILGLLSTIPHLVIIITMRGNQSPGSQDIRWLKVEIKPVANEDALNIYRQRAEREPDEWVYKLLEAVDNIPLAVTLISHLVKEDGQSPQFLWARWQKGRTSVLENGGTDRLSKLDASIWLSVQSPRMDENSRNLLHLLSLLPDGLNSEFDIPLPDIPDISSLLLTLQRVSLIYTTSIPGSSAIRYNMLSPIREYCQNAANFTTPPRPEWKLAFTAFFADLVVDHPNYTNPNHYSIVVPELRNIRSILMGMTQEGIPNVQAAIEYTEWSKYIGTCDVEVILKSLQFTHDPSDLALGYRVLGLAQQHKHKLDGAEDSFTKSLKVSKEAEDSQAIAAALQCIGDLHLRRDNLDEAKSSLFKTREMYDQMGAINDGADVHFSLGRLHMRCNELEDAEQSFIASLALYETAQRVLGQANVHHCIGDLYMGRGDLDEAKKLFSIALTLYEQIPGVLGQATVHHSMGELHMKRGDLDDAEKSLSIALPLYEQIRDVLGQANVHRNMSELHMRRGHLDDAEKSLYIVLPLYVQIQDVLGQANVHRDMGELHMTRGDLDDAQKSFSIALPLYEQIQDVLGQANVHRDVGELHMKRGDLDDAEKSLSIALPLYEQIQDVLGQANVHRFMGELHIIRGDLDDAEKLFSNALTFYQRTHSVIGQADVNNRLGNLHLERRHFGAAEASFSTSLALYGQVRNPDGQEVVRRNIRRLEELKAGSLGLGSSIGEAISLP